MLNWVEIWRVPRSHPFSFSGDDALNLSGSVVVTPIIKSLMKQFTVVRCEIWIKSFLLILKLDIFVFNGG